MNFSVKGEYALKAIFDLASQPPGEPVKIADIAQRQQIPQKFLELILASLKQNEKSRARRQADSPFHEIWARVDRAVSEQLDSMNFAAVCRDWAEKRTRFVPNWEI
jgi:DNA-binding IscR family transcriptional regulator